MTFPERLKTAPVGFRWLHRLLTLSSWLQWLRVVQGGTPVSGDCGNCRQLQAFLPLSFGANQHVRRETGLVEWGSLAPHQPRAATMYTPSLRQLNAIMDFDYFC